MPQIHQDQVEAAERWALEPFERQGDEGPFKVQADLQDMMQDLVGIVRKEDEMVRALDGLQKLRARAAKVAVTGNREYNPGWHTAMDLHSLLTVSEAVTRAAILRKESRGAQFRDDYPKKDNASFGKVNSIVWRGSDGSMQIRLDPILETRVARSSVPRRSASACAIDGGPARTPTAEISCRSPSSVARRLEPGSTLSNSRRGERARRSAVATSCG